MDPKNLPRGIRNCNPLNIIKSNTQWLGKVPNGTDPVFEQFTSIEYGLRAAILNLKAYITRHYVDTPQSIIHRWSPDGEPRESNYIATACKKAGLNPHERIKFTEKNKVCRLVWGMAYVECGQEISFGRIENAYSLATNGKV